ncbi:HEAT repeat domain-containing protein [Kaarinaea lacus]
MNESIKPGAMLMVSTYCPHCHALNALLDERRKTGALGKLEVINIDHSPEVARQLGIRSVPWLKLGEFIFDGAMTPAELDRWITHAKNDSGQSDYVAYLLEHGKLGKAIEWVEQGRVTLEAVIPLINDLDAKMNVRVGVGAILEHFEGSPAIREIIPDLIGLMQNDHPAIRTDACHYLSLTGSMDVIESLKKLLDDNDEQVRQVAQESIDALFERAV